MELKKEIMEKSNKSGFHAVDRVWGCPTIFCFLKKDKKSMLATRRFSEKTNGIHKKLKTFFENKADFVCFGQVERYNMGVWFTDVTYFWR